MENKFDESMMIIGLTTEEAKQFLDGVGCSMRIIRNNGSYLKINDSFVSNRLNVSIENDIIKSVNFVG